MIEMGTFVATLVAFFRPIHAGLQGADDKRDAFRRARKVTVDLPGGKTAELELPALDERLITHVGATEVADTSGSRDGTNRRAGDRRAGASA